MKEHYEMQQFTKTYSLLAGVFCVLIFLSGFWCSHFQILPALVLTGLSLIFALSGYVLCAQILRRTLQDIANVNEAMVAVVEGSADYEKEPYKEGTLGVLYTNFYKMVGTLRESRLKALEEKKALQDTISDISHQLKTPLASLQVFVDLLYEDKVSDPQKQKEILQETANQLGRMEWLVLSMLKLARIEAGAVTFTCTRCNAVEIARAAADAVSYLTGPRRQRIRISQTGKPGIDEPDASIDLSCDKEWLTEALINLLKNASDYSPEDTTITILLEDNRLYTRISVQDQGMGIPDEALPHIFERFYRVNHEVNPNSVGIGLSLTKSIVEGMNGRITVRSKVGESTCFLLTFLKK